MTVASGPFGEKERKTGVGRMIRVGRLLPKNARHRRGADWGVLTLAADGDRSTLIPSPVATSARATQAPSRRRFTGFGRNAGCGSGGRTPAGSGNATISVSM